MNPTLQKLKDAASILTVDERAELVQFLLRSLGEPREPEALAEWVALAEQRMAEVRAGKVTGVPAAQVLDSIRRPRP